MSNNKNDKNNKLDFEMLASHIGLAACSIAAIAGLIDLHEGRQPKLVTQMQPSFAHVIDSIEQAGHHLDMRKEKDEIKHMTVSYGVTMRSHPVSGTL